MQIEEIILQEEKLITLKKNLMHLLEQYGQLDLANNEREEIKDLEKSLEHNRKIQMVETSKSGRKEWWHNPTKYLTVYLIGAITPIIIEFLLSKI